MSDRASEKLRDTWQKYTEEVFDGLLTAHVPPEVIYTQLCANRQAWNVYIFVRGQLRHAAILELSADGDVTLHESVLPITQDAKGSVLPDVQIGFVPQLSHIKSSIMRAKPLERQNRRKSQNIGRKRRK